MHKEISAKLDSYLDYAVELETALTAIPALSPVNGGDGEYDKACFLETELKKLKFDEIFRIDAPHKEAKNGIRPNIVARYKGQSSARTLWIMSHLDIVPPGELSLWKSDPYKVRREGNVIYGRGVEDNQQGLVGSMLCARAMMELGCRPPVDLALIFNADEETGSAYGAGYVLNERRDIFGPNDMFLVPDGGAADGKLVEIAEKSILWLKIKTSGKQCHASMPQLGINSFKAASDFVVRLGSLYRKFNAKDKLFQPKISTFEPTKKEANVPNINTLPGEDVFYLDCRVLPNYTLDEVLAEIRAIAAAVEKKHGVTISFDFCQREQAAPATSPDSEIARLVIEGISKVYRVKAKPRGIGGGTVAAHFRKAGFPSVVYAKHDETAHMPNESCHLENLIGDAKVFAYAALNAKP